MHYSSTFYQCAIFRTPAENSKFYCVLVFIVVTPMILPKLAIEVLLYAAPESLMIGFQSRFIVMPAPRGT